MTRQTAASALAPRRQSSTSPSSAARRTGDVTSGQRATHERERCGDASSPEQQVREQDSANQRRLVLEQDGEPHAGAGAGRPEPPAPTLASEPQEGERSKAQSARKDDQAPFARADGTSTSAPRSNANVGTAKKEIPGALSV